MNSIARERARTYGIVQISNDRKVKILNFIPRRFSTLFAIFNRQKLSAIHYSVIRNSFYIKIINNTFCFCFLLAKNT